MTIATYSDLQTSIANWTGDTFTDAQRQEFIGLAEAEFNRVLRSLDMEVRATATLESEYLALPEAFLKLRAIYIQDVLLEPATPQFIRRMEARSGQPQYYAITDGQIQFSPSPDDDYTVEIIYYKRIPALSGENTSNWLLEAHPDLYLSQCLALAETFGWNDARAAAFAATASRIIEEINLAENSKRLGAMPLKMARPLNAPRN